MAPTKIFLTGATGYIGGSILTSLLKHPEKYSVSALIRNPTQKGVLEKLGATPIMGSLEDSDLLFESAKNADAVINTADADHLPAAQALVRGLKARSSGQNKKAVFLHTSGLGVLTFNPTTDVPFDDEDMDRIHSIPLHSPHKEIDNWIYNNVDDITAAIIYPATVNGVGTGPFRKSSVQVRTIAKASVKRRQAGYTGSNRTVYWDNVHILDLVDLYNLVLEGLLENKIDHGKKGGCYFAATHTHTWYDVAKKMAPILYRLEKVDSEEVTQFEEGCIDPVNTPQLSHDSKAVSNRSRRIGWNPTRPDIFETLEEEIRYLVENEKL